MYVVAYDIPEGNIATYFPEANVLVPLKSTADKSNTPTSKWIILQPYGTRTRDYSRRNEP